MDIVSIFQPQPLRLSENFLRPYYAKGDPFESLLSRSTYLTKYCRDGETWTDTIRRVVEGNMALVGDALRDEAEKLFHLFWTGQALPPGRGLWTGGVDGIPADARYNCWAVSLRSIDDWCWTANQLMLGGGVGVGLGSISNLPFVTVRPARFAVWCKATHPDYDEVKPNDKSFLNGQTPVFVVADSREGWVESLRRVLTAAFEGTDLIVDVSGVRARGLPIRTFGGTACGPGPLVNLLRNAWAIVRGAVGRQMSSVECLDVTNFIGLCIKAGNVRRSALIVLGDANDQEFRNAKKDWEAVKSHRHTSNNSIVFRNEQDIQGFDWDRLVEDNAEFGEPGIINLALIQKTDPGATGINPCFSGDTKIAVADGRNYVTIRQLAEEERDVPVYSVDKATGKVAIKMGRHPRVTGYEKSLVRVHLDDGSYLDTTPEHKFLLREGGEVLAKDLKYGMSLPRFTKRLEKVVASGKQYYRMYCDTRAPERDKLFEHRLIARFHDPDGWNRVYISCKKNGFANTGGLVVHHKDYNPLNNSPNNLQIMSFRDHTILHAEQDTAGEQNGHWSGFTTEQIKEHAFALTKELGRRFSRKDWQAYAKKNGLPVQFSEYRSKDLGSVTELAKTCASELGLALVGEDPRVVRTYHDMLDQGYNVRINEGVVLVEKTCEGCKSPFEVPHGHRERSFCSEVCGNAYINSNTEIHARRVGALHSIYSEHMGKVKVDQARVCSALKFKLGRTPNRKEWSLACKEGGLPSRIGPTLKFGYKSFGEVLTAANDYNHKVVRVEELPGLHTVYNITVDDHHTVGVVTSDNVGQGNLTGVYVTQCGEIPLHDREACNLAEVFPAKFHSATNVADAFRLVTRYSLRQRLTPLMDFEAEAIRVKNMRTGVGLGGLCDFEWDPAKLSSWYTIVRDEADSYASTLGVNRPIATTTVKPSGTISLLNGSSPGIHAPYAPYYLRRVRIAKNDSLAGAMMDAGVPYEPCVYDRSGHTLVFGFPMRALNAKVTVQEEGIRDQFERQKTVQQHWADNSVSATLSFDSSEKGELADCLREFVPHLKSTSCLPKSHGYEQAPYSVLSSEEYERLYNVINHDHPLTRDGDIQVDECAGGACPIR